MDMEGAVEQLQDTARVMVALGAVLRSWLHHFPL